MLTRTALIKDFMTSFWKEEDGFIGGLISAGLGLVSSVFGKKSAKKETAQANQGFDYLKSNPMVGAAQQAGQDAYNSTSQAGGLLGGMLGLGGGYYMPQQGQPAPQQAPQYQPMPTPPPGATGGNRALDGGLAAGVPQPTAAPQQPAPQVNQWGQRAIGGPSGIDDGFSSGTPGTMFGPTQPQAPAQPPAQQGPGSYQTDPATGQPVWVSAQQAGEDAFAQFRNSSGYQFRLSEGQRGIEGSAAARGVLNSGAAAKSLTRYSQDFASNELGTFMDRLQHQQGIDIGLSESAKDRGLNAALGVGQAGGAAGASAAAATARGTENQVSGIGGLVRGVASIFGF